MGGGFRRREEWEEGGWQKGNAENETRDQGCNGEEGKYSGCQMGIFKSITRWFKGACHAGKTENRLSGRAGDERRILHTLAAIRENARADLRGIGMLAAGCAAQRSGNPGPLPEDPLRRESRTLIAAAKRTGCFLDLSAVPGTRYTIRSGESEVRFLQDLQLYHKIKNPFAKCHVKRHPPEYVLFEHVVHNILFPDCRLEFLGIAEELREARIVYSQNAVRSETRPDDAQIAAHLARELGLRPEDRYAFGNEYVFVTDVGQDGDNVLVDDAGELRFIDPIIGFKPPLIPLLDEALVNDTGADTLVRCLLGVPMQTPGG